uniref:Asparaginase n=1 Tax=Macrostomum lignano TaxID=282301 RepID=A0A1I8F7G6_9PLAT
AIGGYAFEFGDSGYCRQLLERQLSDWESRFEFLSIFAKDGQDISDVVVKLAEVIKSSGSRRVLVTHGTDTLLDTARLERHFPFRPVPSRSVPFRPVPSRSFPFRRPVPSRSVPFRPVPFRPFRPVPSPFRPVPSRSVPFVPFRPVPSVPSRSVPFVPFRPVPSRPVRPVPFHFDVASTAAPVVILTGARLPGAFKDTDADLNIGFALGCLAAARPAARDQANGGNRTTLLKPGVYTCMNLRLMRPDEVKLKLSGGRARHRREQLRATPSVSWRRPRSRQAELRDLLDRERQLSERLRRQELRPPRQQRRDSGDGGSPRHRRRGDGRAAEMHNLMLNQMMARNTAELQKRRPRRHRRATAPPQPQPMFMPMPGFESFMQQQQQRGHRGRLHGRIEISRKSKVAQLKCLCCGWCQWAMHQKPADATPKACDTSKGVTERGCEGTNFDPASISLFERPLEKRCWETLHRIYKTPDGPLLQRSPFATVMGDEAMELPELMNVPKTLSKDEERVVAQENAMQFDDEGRTSRCVTDCNAPDAAYRPVSDASSGRNA